MLPGKLYSALSSHLRLDLELLLERLTKVLNKASLRSMSVLLSMSVRREILKDFTRKLVLESSLTSLESLLLMTNLRMPLESTLAH
jgi:predicted membrane protein